MPSGRPPGVSEHEMAVALRDDGNVYLVLPDGSDPFEMGPRCAVEMGKALIAAGRAAADLRAAIRAAAEHN